jgi:hypothetical protein
VDGDMSIGVVWRPHAHVDKYSPDQVRDAVRRLDRPHVTGDDFTALGMTPEDGVADSDGNLLTTAGLTRLVTLITGGSVQALTGTATRIGSGNGTGTAAVTDTDMSATTHTNANQWYQVMDATYPTVAGGLITFRSTFSTEGNYAWNEWGIDVGTPTVTSSATVNALLLSHKTGAALGTKSAGSWVITATVTIS